MIHMLLKMNENIHTTKFNMDVWATMFLMLNSVATIPTDAHEAKSVFQCLEIIWCQISNYVD